MAFFAEHGFPPSEFRRLGFGPVVRKDELENLREFGPQEIVTVTMSDALAPELRRQAGLRDPDYTMPLLRIDPLPGYAPIIGRLVAMMTYSRTTLLQAVDGLTMEALDHLHDPRSNSIGALLAHNAAVERFYQRLTFEGRVPSTEESAAWAPAIELGDAGRRALRGHDLAWYLDELSATRAATLAALAERDDAWLETPLAAVPRMNPHFAWFHVMEDELNHRGQIRWLRARLPGRAATVEDTAGGT